MMTLRPAQMTMKGMVHYIFFNVSNGKGLKQISYLIPNYTKKCRIRTSPIPIHCKGHTFFMINNISVSVTRKKVSATQVLLEENDIMTTKSSGQKEGPSGL